MYKIDTEVINLKTDDRGRVVCIQGDGGQYAVNYGTPIQPRIEWEVAEDLARAGVRPLLIPARSDRPE